MANLFTWVEIPTSDMERAKTFYAAILGLKEELKVQDMNDMLYTFLPMTPGDVSGALVQHPNYLPGQGQGVCVYLTAQGDLNATLERIEANGGKIVIPKTSLDDMSPGYMAQFIDSEGNRVGLWSEE